MREREREREGERERERERGGRQIEERMKYSDSRNWDFYLKSEGDRQKKEREMGNSREGRERRIWC